MDHQGFPIKIAAQRSGLSVHLIRAWEKRYAAVDPLRSLTRRRLYTDAEIQRLGLLRRVTSAGHPISSVAGLSNDRLVELLGHQVREEEPTGYRVLPKPPGIASELLDQAFAAVAALDARELESILHQGLVKFGRTAVMQQVLVPLIHRIGDAWQSGDLRVAHEHIASAVIRTFLGNFVRAHSGTVNAPVLLVTTPAGQLHELGALLAAAAASDQGWDVTYLGPNLPTEEIAGAFVQNRADAIAISIVYPDDDPSLPRQLKLLRELLPAGVPILAGGRSAGSYREALTAIGASISADLPSFIEELSAVRRSRRAHRPGNGQD